MKNIEIHGKQTLYFFGGPYSNLEATQELKHIFDKKGISPKHIFCTGDTLAYCSNPNETLSLLKSWGVTSIKGNVEEQIANDEDSCGCNFSEGSQCDLLSNNWYNYLRSNISPDSISYIRSFPNQLRIETHLGNIRMIHGGVRDISNFLYKKTHSNEFIKELDYLEDDISIIVSGHSGIPFGKKINDKLWLNAGVIGMPANDGTRKGWYLELKLEDTITANFKSFTYNSQQSSSAMIENNLPIEYAKTLLSGIWPNQDTLPLDQRDEQGIEITNFSIK